MEEAAPALLLVSAVERLHQSAAVGQSKLDAGDGLRGVELD